MLPVNFVCTPKVPSTERGNRRRIRHLISFKVRVPVRKHTRAQLRRRRVRRFVSDHFMPRDLFIRACVCLCVFRGAIRLEPRVDSRRPRVVEGGRVRRLRVVHVRARHRSHLSKVRAVEATTRRETTVRLDRVRVRARPVAALQPSNPVAFRARALVQTRRRRREPAQHLRPRATGPERRRRLVRRHRTPSSANADEGDDGRARQRAQQRRGGGRSVGVTTIPSGRRRRRAVGKQPPALFVVRVAERGQNRRHRARIHAPRRAMTTRIHSFATRSRGVCYVLQGYSRINYLVVAPRRRPAEILPVRSSKTSPSCHSRSSRSKAAAHLASSAASPAASRGLP